VAYLDVYGFEEFQMSGPAEQMLDTGRSLRAFIGLLPPGRMFGGGEPPTLHEERHPNLHGLVRGLSLEGERVLARIDQMVAAEDPRKAPEFLPEYEEMFGLPDATGSATTIEERAKACYERKIARGDMSPDNLKQIAANLGYTIHVQFAMWDVWESGEGGGETGETESGEPWDGLIIHVVGGSNDPQLEAAITRMVPAHMYVDFNYL
jgi:hypothetical protein